MTDDKNLHVTDQIGLDIPENLTKFELLTALCTISAALLPGHNKNYKNTVQIAESMAKDIIKSCTWREWLEK